MVAHLRHIGILSRLRVPFTNGEPCGRNMDICPDKRGWSGGKPYRLSAVLPERLFARQERNNRAANDRKAADSGGLAEPDVNQQTWPTDQIGWTGNGRLSRPRWVSGGI